MASIIEFDEMPLLTATQRERKPFDVERIRQDFPILGQRIYGKPLAYLDNAATSQKPQAVIDAITRYYSTQNANIHRGVYYLSEIATQAYEDSREYIRRFLNANSTREIIFTRGTTEGINLVAHAFGRLSVKEGDEVIISTMEHHSNIVPWQILCEEKGAKLRVIPINDDGEMILEEYARMLSERTKLVAIVQISNSLGTINPVERMTHMAHEVGAVVLVDGAQVVPHAKVDVQALDVDFFTFSGHKVFGPTGVGILYGKEELLESMPPYQGGGDMILSVTFEKTIYNELPYKFEAGTPNIADGIALSKALEYVEDIGYENIALHENALLAYATDSLLAVDGLKIIGTAREKASVISFVIEGIHPHDVGTILDHEGVAIRTGHHCTQPVMARFGVPATSRASLAFYNTKEDVDRLVAGLRKVIRMFR
jgi:cysteine desulfurase/selenocysteine lyase